jgi:hypothetical protein
VFAIPGIAALMVFILVRPQEFVPLLQRVPFLHLFTALAILGWVIDVRLRRLTPVGVPTLGWVVALIVWALVGTAAVAPDQLMARIVDLLILFALYGVIAHGVQRFRTFQVVAGVLATACMFITIVCWHQGLSPMQCVGGAESEGDIMGQPDGRLCESNEVCRGPDAEPGFEYRCEHVGMFGTYSVEGRVRYRGDLHDPNEIALAISAGCLSLMIGFAMRKRQPLQIAFFGTCAVITFWTIFMTQSRGGLIAGMLVPGVYLVKKYGVKILIPALAVALPVLLLGGRSGEAADLSTSMRYEAWATGLGMFHASPLFGVGAKLFTRHHFLTAHNSYVLAFTELGLPGFICFIGIIYLSMKTLIVGLREVDQEPGAEVARTWGMSLLASFAGVLFQINTLSFTYHPVLWIFWGLIGAWCGAIRHHKPSFNVTMTWRDFGIVVFISCAYVFVILPIFLKAKGFL